MYRVLENFIVASQCDQPPAWLILSLGLEGGFFPGQGLPLWLGVVGLLDSMTHSHSIDKCRGSVSHRVTDPPRAKETSQHNKKEHWPRFKRPGS